MYAYVAPVNYVTLFSPIGQVIPTLRVVYWELKQASLSQAERYLGTVLSCGTL
jgi:hypothetical protein